VPISQACVGGRLVDGKKGEKGRPQIWWLANCHKLLLVHELRQSGFVGVPFSVVGVPFSVAGLWVSPFLLSNERWLITNHGVTPYLIPYLIQPVAGAFRLIEWPRKCASRNKA